MARSPDMNWNYRIIDHGNHLALHEVHYDKTGAVRYWTAEPIMFVAAPEEGAEGIAGALQMALADARNRPVLAISELRDIAARRAE